MKITGDCSFSTTDVAVNLGISRMTVIRRCKTGKIHARRFDNTGRTASGRFRPMFKISATHYEQELNERNSMMQHPDGYTTAEAAEKLSLAIWQVRNLCRLNVLTSSWQYHQARWIRVIDPASIQQYRDVQNSERYATVKELQAALGCPERSAYKLIQSGRVPGARKVPHVGWRIPREFLT